MVSLCCSFKFDVEICHGYFMCAGFYLLFILVMCVFPWCVWFVVLRWSQACVNSSMLAAWHQLNIFAPACCLINCIWYQCFHTNLYPQVKQIFCGTTNYILLFNTKIYIYIYSYSMKFNGKHQCNVVQVLDKSMYCVVYFLMIWEHPVLVTNDLYQV